MSDFQIDDRELAHPFRVLPSKTEYPDYYNIIKKPIDMSKIQHRLNQSGKSTDYTSIDEMCSDFAQMFENACTYNEPTSTIYKDALTLQKALFSKRDEIYMLENKNNDPEKLPVKFVTNSIQEIIEQLFEACMCHRDSEGRVYSETFLQLYEIIEKSSQNDILDLVTLEYMRKRVYSRVYKRMDVFQEEMFLFFNQIRLFGYIDGDFKLKKETNAQLASIHPLKKIHRYSQLYRDTYELQRFFIEKRDELCKNGELLQSSALNFKITALDSYLSMTIGGTTFDEAEALLVDTRFKHLENKLNMEEVFNTTTTPTATTEVLMSNLSVGCFYYLNKKMLMCNLEPKVTNSQSMLNYEDSVVVCVLAANANKTKFIVQPYLKVNQIGR